MAQVTIHLPDAVERAVRREAKRAKKSISAYLTDLARAEIGPRQFPAGFERLFGSWIGELPDVPDRRAEPVEP